MTDLELSELMEKECIRDLKFIGLKGEKAETYKAGYEQGVGKVLAYLRENGYMAEKIVDILGSKFLQHSFKKQK